MKKLTALTIMLLLSGLLTTVAFAGQNTKQKPQAQKGQTVQTDQTNQQESEGLKLRKAYYKKHEEAKARRDAAMKLRSRNVANNSPGNTGM